MNNNIEMLLTNFLPNKIELPSKLLEQMAFNTRHKIEKHILVDMDKSTDEEHLSQPLQTNIKQFKIVVTFLTGCNGVINVTKKLTNFISGYQLLIKMIQFELVYYTELTNSTA